MRIPDPKANTTTEAYLAYKAGYLEESELKPVLYEPYLHFDAWLAYWAGLTNTYPEKNVGRESYTTPLGRTVYGGTLDVTSGVLTVGEYGIVVDGINHRFINKSGYWHITPYDYPTIKVASGTAPALVYSDITSGTSKWGTAGSRTQMFTRASDWTGVFNSVDELNALGITVVYELETPQTYQLTPQTVEMIAERSTFQSNANGNIDITYYANGILKTVSGNPVIITDADGQNAEDVTVHIEPIQSGSGTPSPTNIRPISGMTDINITRLSGVAEPEMLTDEEALVAYLSGVTNTYPEEIKDPYDVRIVGYLKYLVSARWGRPEYPVNNEEFYLSTMKPPVVPSGDTPSSDIEMDDTAEAPFIDLKMYGDTSQNTCAGDQLLTKQGFATPITDTNFWGSFAQGKLKHTPLADGWAGIEVKETSGSVFGDMNINQEGVKGFAANTTYTMIVEIKDKSGAGTDDDNMKNLCLMQPSSIRDAWESSSVNIVQGAIWTGNTNVVITLADSDWTSRTAVIVATTKEDLTNVFSCRFFTRPNVPAGTSFKIRVSVLAGDHSSDWQNYAGDNYQPYVGGIASPNPDYPQAVQTVTGEQTVRVTGKNLFDISAYDDESVWTGDTYKYIAIPLPNGTYTISWDKSKGGGFYWLVQVDGTKKGTSIPGSGGSWLWHNTNTSLQNETFTFTVTEGYVYFSSYVSGGYFVQRLLPALQTIQIEKGETATAYQPYQSQTYKINLGKNLLDVSQLSQAATDIGQIVVDGLLSDTTPTDDGRYWNYGSSNWTITLSPGIYTLSETFTKRCTNSSIASLRIYTSSGTLLLDNYSITDKDHVANTFTLTETTTIGIMIKVADGECYVQLEKGSTATSYAPYFEPIELCKIGDYQDYIYCDRGGDWFIHKEIGKMVFDNNTNWSKHSTTNGNVFRLPSTGLVGYGYNTGTKAPALMDTDICIALGSQPDSTYGAFGITESQQLRLFRGEYDAEYTAEKLKSEMVGHYVCGALVTPTDTEITDSLLLSQLNALFEGGSYEDKTFIKVTATDPNLPGLLYVEAGKYD